ncbi:MAG: TM2 domain-containing protein [Clostridia bacterium]|nr:TM2 domain-containing protein [Clostridia bacterium]
MQAEKVNDLLLFFKNQVPNDKLDDLAFLFERTNDEQYENLKKVTLKSPKLTRLYAITLGFLGIDRFYIGDVSYGIQKLLFSILTLGIWPLVDIFITYRLCQEENFIKIRDSLKDFI